MISHLKEIPPKYLEAQYLNFPASDLQLIYAKFYTLGFEPASWYLDHTTNITLSSNVNGTIFS